MKKLFWIGIGALLAVAVMASAGLAYAQTQDDPPTPFSGVGPMYGGGRGGMHGGQGMMGGRQPGYSPEEAGPLHDYITTALADALGLDVEAFQARLEAGETPYQIAEAEGLTADEIRVLFADAHETALAEAVADGVITQEQADWMNQRMGGQFGAGGQAGGGRRGAGQGQGLGPCGGIQP